MGGLKVGVAITLAGVPMMIFVLVFGLVAIVDAADRPGLGMAGGGLLPGSVPRDYETFITAAGMRCPEITAPLIAAQLEQESGFNPRTVSPAGAEGIAQVTPATWRIWGADHSGDGVADVWNPEDAIGSQADYMCGLVDLIRSWIARGQVDGDVLELALAGYNAGPGWVLQARGMPQIPETLSYVKLIMSAVQKFTAAADQAGSTQVETAIAAAEAQDHDRYVFGADGPDAWDCASLVQHAWRVAGVELPRTTFEQVASPLLTEIPWADRQRGDLIYFHIDGAALPDHVGLILDDHVMIHASHPHPNPEDDIVHADYTTAYYRRARPIVLRVVSA
ncbi:MAG: C40 family peptidase [Microlunatus sp.]|nr:C40 family peptidase [Microlunatus sp.]